ncbi:MAG: chemotaxis response regulator protein-glutamate methylesterase [bacterium]|nr:chemotaxis response regulator protein-glutamate methylesterase [bacterium]
MAKASLTKQIRALVVDDSAYLRRLISNTLNGMPRVEVVATAFNGQEAITMVLRQKPDLITLDLEMPEMNGFTFLRWLMHNQPTPTIVISAEGREDTVLRALDLGAADFIVKPTRKISPELGAIQDLLIEKVISLRDLKIEKVKDRLETRLAQREEVQPVSRGPTVGNLDIVTIGASTGGPPAIQMILNLLPADFPTPVAVAQHMPPSFTRFFAERLNGACKLKVKEAEEGDEICPGLVLIAPGGKNMRFERRAGSTRVVLTEKKESDRYVPSVDVMMESAAEIFGSRTLGVILTGMGNDGTEGMAAIKKAQGQTMAESEETAVIFGMPGEAIERGVVDQVIKLDRVAEMIRAACTGERQS